MAKKEVAYKGRTTEELMSMSTEDFLKIIPTRQRRSYKRGLSAAQKILLFRLDQFKLGKRKKPVKTHCRDMLVLPLMLNQIIHIHNGKEFVPVQITPDMIGRYLGEFAMTRRKVEHSAPGIGATKSSAAMSVK